MNRIIVSATAFVVLTCACVTNFAQTRPAPTPTPARPATPPPMPITLQANVPPAKIAVVDTTVFGDEKAGIKRYLNAVNTVQRGFDARTAELRNLQSQIKAIADDINKLSGNPVVSQESLRTKQADGERLQRELKYKKEQADADFEKRYSEVVGPVSNDIGNALIQYAAQNGLTMILDISKMLPAVLSVNPAMDVTQAFIADYNSKHP